MKIKTRSIFNIVFCFTIIIQACGVSAFYNTSGYLSKIEEDTSDNFDKLILHIMEYGHFPSISTCIIKNDKVVWSNGYGLSHIQNEISATPDTIYGICSITKTITGTALMQLYDQGLFDLDDDVNNFLPFQLRNPNYPDDPITFRMLLSHSSSLQDANSYWNIEFCYEGGPPFSNYPDTWLESNLLPNEENYNPGYWNNEYPPGDRGFYANINFDVIGYLVEILANEPFYEYCHNHIFQPLEMHDTSFNLSLYSIEELAKPYNWDNEHERYRSNHNQVHTHYPAGGIFSSVNDMSHFMIAHMNDGVYNGTRILKESTIKEMHNIQSEGYSLGYGLAWLFESRSIHTGSNRIYFPTRMYNGHGGAVTYGISTLMFMKSHGDTSVLIFTNSDSFMYQTGWNGFQLLRELLFLKAKNYAI